VDNLGQLIKYLNKDIAIESAPVLDFKNYNKSQSI
jgi:hypothetical protein